MTLTKERLQFEIDTLRKKHQSLINEALIADGALQMAEYLLKKLDDPEPVAIPVKEGPQLVPLKESHDEVS